MKSAKSPAGGCTDRRRCETLVCCQLTENFTTFCAGSFGERKNAAKLLRMRNPLWFCRTVGLRIPDSLSRRARSAFKIYGCLSCCGRIFSVTRMCMHCLIVMLLSHLYADCLIIIYHCSSMTITVRLKQISTECVAHRGVTLLSTASIVLAWD